MDFFSPAVVAAVTSLVISLITMFQFINNKRFQESQFDKANNRAFTSKLYDLRLELYPAVFEIMDKVHKEKGGVISVAIIKEACDNLILCKRGVVSLILSNEAHESYYVLRDFLMKQPAQSNEYSAVQIEKITIAIKDFRKQLRRDLGFMFREEKERRRAL